MPKAYDLVSVFPFKNALAKVVVLEDVLLKRLVTKTGSRNIMFMVQLSSDIWTRSIKFAHNFRVQKAIRDTAISRTSISDNM